MNNDLTTKDWFTTHDVAEYSGIKYKHLWTYQKRGVLPEADIHIGNKPIWRRETIEAWSAQRQRWSKLSDRGVQTREETDD